MPCIVYGSAHSFGIRFADGTIDCFTFLLARHLADVLRKAIRDVKQTRQGCRSTTSSGSNTLLPLIHDKKPEALTTMKILSTHRGLCNKMSHTCVKT